MVEVLPGLIELKGVALNLLFPRFCVGCGREGAFICNSCRSTLPRIELPICPQCGIPQLNGTLCYRCVNRPSSIDGIRSPFRFEGAIREAVHQLKYHNLRAIAGSMALLLHRYLQENLLPGDVLVPVPLHPKRQRERGYNQSSLLAMELSQLQELPVDEKSLVREKYTLPQARTTSLEERQRNIIGVFRCRGEGVKRKRVILVDDVSTSGATLNACAAVLKEAGASSVWGLVLAREI